ncbi:MAG: hypothetical protein U0797_14730 [Gemmataceae bacterium]
MFRSTPTVLTHDSMTASSDSRRCLGLTSCWYRPTPTCCGSILTSSLSGSCSRRPIEMVPRSVASKLGNSSRPTELAE